MTNPTILIIDDEPEILKSLSFVLGEEFHALTALNCREGLSIIKSRPLSLILLDLQMPEMTGMELLEKVRNTDSKTPVIILTGNSCQDWAEKCADLNVQGYVKKPIDVDKLICRIKKLLGMEDFEVLQELWNGNYGKRVASLSPAIKNALRYICDSYHKEFNRSEIAVFLKISPDYLSRQFHKESGLSLHDYINRLRVLKSKELLRDSRNKNKEIAAAVGISDVSYFCAMFKKHTGMTPKEYQKKMSPSVHPTKIVIGKHPSVAERSV